MTPLADQALDFEWAADPAPLPERAVGEAIEQPLDEEELSVEDPNWSREVKLRQLKKMGIEPTEGMLGAAEAIDRSARKSARTLNRAARSGQVKALRAPRVAVARTTVRRLGRSARPATNPVSWLNSSPL